MKTIGIELLALSIRAVGTIFPLLPYLFCANFARKAKRVETGSGLCMKTYGILVGIKVVPIVITWCVRDQNQIYGGVIFVLFGWLYYPELKVASYFARHAVPGEGHYSSESMVAAIVVDALVACATVFTVRRLQKSSQNSAHA